MIEFKRARVHYCATCGKDVPVRWYYWCNNAVQFCSYNCWHNSQLRRWHRTVHGNQLTAKLKRSLIRVFKYKLNPLYHLKNFDGFKWGY